MDLKIRWEKNTFKDSSNISEKYQYRNFQSQIYKNQYFLEVLVIMIDFQENFFIPQSETLLMIYLFCATYFNDLSLPSRAFQKVAFMLNLPGSRRNLSLFSGCNILKNYTLVLHIRLPLFRKLTSTMNVEKPFVFKQTTYKKVLISLTQICFKRSYTVLEKTSRSFNLSFSEFSVMKRVSVQSKKIHILP